jgi:RimJ/RimL family protein N-acetyltransferase
MTHKGTVTLETERLILRPLTMDDFEAVHSWASNSANTRYMSFEPNSEEDTKTFLASAKLGNDFAVALKDSSKVIGSCGIYPDNANDTGKLGWILHMDYWKQGYGTELGGELIRYGFEDLKLRRIYAPCVAINYGSYRIMERNGMRLEALHRKAFWSRVDKEWIDSAVYAILAEDYFRTAKQPEITIIPYESANRDDMLFCYLSAKDAIATSYAPNKLNKPHLRDDLLNIEANYIQCGNIFYLAIDECDRVVGMLGTKTASPTDLWLKRLFIKPALKGKGIGSKLLAAVEKYASDKGVTTVHTRFADWYVEAARFYTSKGFVETEPDGDLRHCVKRL